MRFPNQIVRHTFPFLFVLGCLALCPCGEAAEARMGVQSKGPAEYMFVSSDGKKAWFSALELEQVARNYILDQKIEFRLEGTERAIWVNTNGGKVLADVWFTSKPGKPSLQISIGRKGTVLKHKIVEPPAK